MMIVAVIIIVIIMIHVTIMIAVITIIGMVTDNGQNMMLAIMYENSFAVTLESGQWKVENQSLVNNIHCRSAVRSILLICVKLHDSM